MSKRDFGSIKSLLHFDFPYYNEPRDGLDDEVRGAVWERVGNTKLAGIKIPYEYEGSPKFGYRCAYFPDTISYIKTTNTNGGFDLAPTGSYEFECFVKAGGTTSAIDYEAQGYKFYNGHMFKYYSDTKTWANAKTACEELGGHLATSTSAEKNTFLTTLTTDSAWIGGTDETEEGVWQWVTGEEWNYTNWASGQPDNANSAEHYLEINFGGDAVGTWNDNSASTTLCYICEWDSLDSAIPNILKDNGYKFYNGHTFKLFTTGKTWADTKNACEALGGHVATSTSAEKNAFLVTVANGSNIRLGGTDEETEGVWQWVTGEEWNYTNWKSGEPSNSGAMGEENCLTMVCDGSHTTGVWIDQTHLYEIPYICEWDYDMRGGISDGYILNLDNELALSIESGALQLTSTSWGIDETSQTTLTADTWQHILLRLSSSTAKLYLDGTEALSTSITSNATLAPDSITLGGYVGYMDEFVFRNEADTDAPTVPTHPYNGTLDIAKVGGYGTGLDGDAEIRIISQINSYGLINSITDSKTFTVSSWSNGDLLPSAGSEVMLHITAPKSETAAEYPLVGLYAFSKIASVIGTAITLEDEITIENGYDFTLSSNLLSTYYVQVITVPNYENLTINAGVTVNPLTWSTTTGGGIVAFRCAGDCEVNGSILTHGYGATRYDLQQMTNAKLIDRFLCGSGGGLFITCGGTFTAGSSARLGATWSGELTGGSGGRKANGGNGGAGYGGGGAGDIDNSGLGGAGGVGGGGGSGNEGSGGDAGTSGTGGYGVRSGTTYSGGTQGKTAGGNSPIVEGDSGGGGAGGNSGNSLYRGSVATQGVAAGANIILITKTLKADTAAISTGGKGGNANNDATGGGGTGFCYIACREQVSENA